MGQSEGQPCLDALGAMQARWTDPGFRPNDMKALNKRVSKYWRDWNVAAKRREMETTRELRRGQEESSRRARARRYRLISTAVVLLLCACLPACKKKSPTPAPVQPAEAPSPSEPVRPAWLEKLSPERQAAWLAAQKLEPAKEAKAARDRAELVRPAPPDFKPENADRRIRLRLVAQKKMMRAGENFWYRLELQNVGRKPIHWYERSSFFKHGRLSYSEQGFQFFVRQPDGKERGLTPPISLPLLGEHRKDFSFPPGTSEAEQARRFKRMVDMANINELSITLLPGETLVARPWAIRDPKEADAMFARGEDPDSAIPGLYRELPAFFKFDQIGTYHVRVVYDDRLSPLTEESIESSEKYGISREEQLRTRKLIEADYLGPVQSNAVSLEVTP